MCRAASGSNFSVAAAENLPVRALSYKAAFSIRATKDASARLALVKFPEGANSSAEFTV
jgi:hypothetical protein